VSLPQPDNTNPVLVAGVSGSVSPDSSTRRLLEIVLNSAAGAGARTQLLDLRTFNLPFASGDWKPEQYPDVARFNGIMHEADAIVWGTPEYHGSYSGVLKNAIDLGYAEYDGKLVALVGVAGGAIGAINALSHLRTVARQLHAWVLPHQVSVARASSAFDENGLLKDEKLQASVEQLGREVARWAKLHAGLRREEE
jgi:FMN reductase